MQTSSAASGTKKTEKSTNLLSSKTSPTPEARDLSEAREPTEHWEQAVFVEAFRYKFPGVRIFAIPNGGFRGISVGKKLKAEGVVSGVPDLFIPEWHLFIEMKKRHGGRLSREQIDWLNYLSSIGYRVAVCRGCDEALLVAEEVSKDRAAMNKACREGDLIHGKDNCSPT